MSNIEDNSFGIITKLDFKKLSDGQVPTTIKDDNKNLDLIWTTSGTNTKLTLSTVNNVKVMNFNTADSVLHNRDRLIQNILGPSKRLAQSNFQFECDIIIPNIKANNMFFNVKDSSFAGLVFNIRNTFIGGLRLELPGSYFAVFNYQFEANRKYNLVVSKELDLYSVYIDGMILSTIESSEYSGRMNTYVTSAYDIAIGASSWSPGTSIDNFIGGMSNINISLNTVKYSNSFTKYGEHLLSRYNFDGLAAGPSTSQNFTPRLEAVVNKTFKWTGNNASFNYSIGGYSTNNTTSLQSNINDKLTLFFGINNRKAHTNIDLINLNDKYKVVYSFVIQGDPEPQVVVNANTKSALDFENGLTDKVATTVWTTENNTVLNETNKLFGNTSLQFNAANQSLQTHENVITGGATPFTIEFYLSHKGRSAVRPDYDDPILTKMFDQDQGMFMSPTSQTLSFYRAPQYINPIESNNRGKHKIKLNDINKITLSYDGAALRSFVNDKLDFVIGTTTGINKSTSGTEYLKLLDRFNPGDNVRKTTYGLIDNINIFDGVANITKTPDEYDQFLAIHVPFEGANNSTNYVNNGTNKYVFMRKVNAANDKLTTDKNLGYGYSSIYLPSNQHTRLSNKSDNSDVTLNLNQDFTLSVETEILINGSGGHIFAAIHAQQNTGLRLYVTTDNKVGILSGDEATAWAGWKINWTSTKLINTATGYNKFDLVRKNNMLYLYVNNDLWNKFNVNFQIDTDAFTLFNLNNSSGLYGYGKNFRFYEGAAVFPKQTSNKTKLEFDNNLNDVHRNSTWTKTATTTYDAVRSVKGFSARLESDTDYIESNEVKSLNFADNNFSLEFDSNIETSYSNGEFLSNNKSPSTQDKGSFYIWNNNNSATGGGFNRGIGFATGNTTQSLTKMVNAFPNQWYKDTVVKKDKFVQYMRNGVIVDAYPYNNTMIHSIDGKFRFGKPSTEFGSAFNGFKGNVDEFKTVNDDFLKNDVVYKNGRPISLNVNSDTLCIGYTTDQSTSLEGQIVYELSDMTPVKDFIIEVKYLIRKSGKGHFLYVKTNHADLSANITNNIDRAPGYSFALSNDSFTIFKGNGTTETFLSSYTLPSKYRDDKFHIIRVTKSGTLMNILIDGVQEFSNATDSEFSDVVSKIGFGQSTWNSPEGLRTTCIEYVKVFNAAGTAEIYNRTWKSEVDLNVNAPALHLPLESNIGNTGYMGADVVAPLTAISSQVKGNRKCIAITSNGYFKINQANILNVGIVNDFYIELDVYHVEAARPQIILNNVDNWKQGAFQVAITQDNKFYIEHKTDTNMAVGGDTYIADNTFIAESWNKIKIFRKNKILTISLNGIEKEFEMSKDINLSLDALYFGLVPWNRPGFVLAGALNNFIYFIGTSKRPESFNDKAVIDLDFKPTKESYLFKDNFNRCVIHQNNITQREYEDSMYACKFNNTLDQYITFSKNDLFNFGKDDFILHFKFKLTEYTSTWRTLLGSAQVSSSSTAANPYTYVCIGPTTAPATYVNRVVISTGYQGGGQFDITCKDPIPLNTIVDMKILVKDSVPQIFINDVDVSVALQNTTTFRDYNFNANNQTIIGKNDNNVNKMHGIIYKFQAYRNTTDMLLVADPIRELKETFKLTNGTDIVEAEFTEIKSHEIRLVSDENKVTMIIDDQTLEVAKDSTVSNVKILDNYKGDIRDIKIYDTPFYDQDVFLGSVAVDTTLPEIDILENEIEGLMVYDIGNYRLTGFIEGYTDREFIIYSSISDQVIYSGIEDYDIFDIDGNYIDKYYIIDQVSNQKYLVNKTAMKKGYISGTINLKKCGVSAPGMKVYCLRSDDQRLIGVYDVDADGKYNIPNLDVNSRYDIIFRDKTRTIKDQLSNYRQPKSY